ncbi:MAG: Gfo/Idh/MocA family oxidoreductase [Planctomycetia bacterium]|nr:Gfo/Idh/MocA family oxidoreductase [Planctomycetia bacterium]
MSENRKLESNDPSRREFLKTSSVAVVGGSLLAGLAVPRSVHAAGDDLIKVGLIGCGGRGSDAVRNALKVPGAVKLTAVGDAFQYKLDASLKSLQRAFGDKIEVPAERQFVGLDAYKKVIDSGVDLVILTTPPGFRPMHFKYAVEKGKHVFMEKPVAVDGPGVRSVLETTRKAKEKNLGVGVGLQRHHHAAYIETIRRLQDGAIGHIHTARVYWNGDGVWVRGRKDAPAEVKTEMQYQVNNWYYFNWLSGDHICEQHIHNLDVINWLKKGYPIKAQGMGGREFRKGDDYGEIYDHHAVEFEYEDGSRMFSFCRHIPHCWVQVSEHVQGSKGKADISGATIAADGQDVWKFRPDRPDPYDQEHVDLFAAIRNGAPYNEGEYGAMSSMTSILGRMATYSGKVIEMKDALASPIKLGPADDGFTWQTTPPVPQVAVPGVTDPVGKRA